jgi:hypothetical protein
MKLLINVFVLLIFFVADLSAQCPPTNPTMTISGLYSADLNPTPGSIIYVTSSGTITGKINLNNASLYNCGTILSEKITMSQSIQYHQYILENNNIMKCDTISLDSLGHLHNNDTLICGLLKLSNNSSVDNNYVMDANFILVEKDSKLNSQANIKTNYFDLKDTNSNFYNLYGNISVRKLFRVGIGTVVYGVIFICVDSCFVNNGIINNTAMQTWTPSIRVNGLSANSGTINTIDFCDLSSTNGGMPDINTGTLSNVTFCSSQQFFCDFTYTSVHEKNIADGKVIVYPNPTSNTLNIRTENFEFENAEIKIINHLGQTILKQTFAETISVTTLANGYYTLSISTENGQFHTKFVKVN